MVTGVHDCTTNQHSVRLESLIGGLHICDLIGQFSGSHTRDLIGQFSGSHTHDLIGGVDRNVSSTVRGFS